MAHDTFASKIRPCSESLLRLAGLLMALPAGQRSGVVWQALTFLPNSTLEESEQIGVYRALLADCWEELTGRAVPIIALRDVLQQPLDTPVSLLLGRLTVADSDVALASALVSLISYLDERTRDNEKPYQPTLFEEDTETPPTPAEHPIYQGDVVGNLQELVLAGRKFKAIYADPPWPYDNEASRAAATNHYPTMSLDDICDEPVAQLAEENAHLHLWTTNAFLREAFDVIEAWGFQYKSCFVWVKDTIGMGNYWRVSHEYLMLGIRGQLTFRDRTQRSWFQCNRMEHSRKPGAIRMLIEKVSPGPYLELYGRAEIPNSPWTIYGNQVERRLF